MMVPSNQSGESLVNALFKPSLVKKEEVKVKEKALEVIHDSELIFLNEIPEGINFQIAIQATNSCKRYTLSKKLLEKITKEFDSDADIIVGDEAKLIMIRTGSEHDTEYYITIEKVLGDEPEDYEYEIIEQFSMKNDDFSSKNDDFS